MKVRLVDSPDCKTQLRFVTEEQSGPITDFEGRRGRTALRYEDDVTVVYCGLGKTADCTSMVLRSAGGDGISAAAGLKREVVAVVPPDLGENRQDHERACLEGVLLGGYSFRRYKSESRQGIREIEFVGRLLSETEIATLETVCESTLFARDLVNENASIVTPEYLASQARALAKGKKSLSCTVLGEKEIEQHGLGLLKAVGAGSATPPRLIIIEYRGNPARKDTKALVGKGITFDSGGYNLKPSGRIETMRLDMAGSAAVLGTMRALAELGPKVNVIGVVPAAHNAVGSGAYLPGDVYRSYAGKTVEITNTDAEGRLILADAFSYVQKQYRPNEIVDLATLTGGILSALGDTVAGLFSNDDALAERLFSIGEKTGERLWRFPVYEEHSEAMKSDLADLRNTAKLKRGYASSITGAAFLSEFVEGIPWAHIDIAGTGFNDGERRGEVPKYATGYGVRLLWEYVVGLAG